MVAITTKVVNSNPHHGKVFLIQHDVINFVCLVAVLLLTPGIWVSSSNKFDRHNITEILLKMVLSIQLTPIILCFSTSNIIIMKEYNDLVEKDHCSHIMVFHLSVDTKIFM